MEPSVTSVVVAAPDDRDNVVAELYYKEKFVLQVGQNDQGELIVELPEKSDDWRYIAQSVPYHILLQGLKAAREEAMA